MKLHTVVFKEMILPGEAVLIVYWIWIHVELFGLLWIIKHKNAKIQFWYFTQGTKS